jgi:hypothetical protein
MRANEDQTLTSIKSTPIDAIKDVIEDELRAGRRAHHINPNLRAYELNNVRNDNVGAIGVRRLTQLADWLGIEVEIVVKPPRRH